MILARAPLRVSLAGGGTDIPAFFQVNEGEVFNFTIDKYVYIAMHEHYPGGFRLKYSNSEEVINIHDIKHPLIRESLLEVNGINSAEIASFADIPSSGSGLGSSSAFTVALLKAIKSFQGSDCLPLDLANTACKIEIERCKEPIGKQDQFASAFGGINHFIFKPDGSTLIQPSLKFDDDKSFLDSCLSLFYLGFGRSASSILSTQSALMNTSNVALQSVDEIKALVPLVIEAVSSQNIMDLGGLVKASWELKRSITSEITNSKIETIMKKVYSLGIYGAKVVGAGGGGFLLVCHEPGMREYLNKNLPFLKGLDFSISKNGAEIVYENRK